MTPPAALPPRPLRLTRTEVDAILTAEKGGTAGVARGRACVGAVLAGKYRLDRVLGAGGMARVFAATHLRNANQVAVKVLHRELSVDAVVRARFLREGDAANRVGHAGTVRVLDDDVAEDGSLFIVMDLLEGETLHARWARRGGKLGAREVVPLLCEVLRVLCAAHAKGIVHRDLKPENLFLTDDGRLKVLDFGLARLRESSPTQTKTGTVFGTPAFMAPEQALGKTAEVDALSDLWAVGATAFTLLSGRIVHPGKTPKDMVVMSATRPAPPLASVARDVPPVVAMVIDRALAFHKADRWPSAEAMLDALLQAQGFLEARDTLQVPVVPAASTSPSAFEGVEWNTQPDPARRRFPVASVVVCGVGIAIAVAVIASVSVGSKGPMRDASAPSADLSRDSHEAPRP